MSPGFWGGFEPITRLWVASRSTAHIVLDHFNTAAKNPISDVYLRTYVCVYVCMYVCIYVYVCTEEKISVCY